MAKKQDLKKFVNPAGAKADSLRPASAEKHKSKVFSVVKMAKDAKRVSGKKIIIYAKTGMGKSTLAAMAPNPVFICPDNGLDDLDHPFGDEFAVIPDVTTFQDVRDAVSNHSLFDDYDTVVIDTLTVVQGLCADHVVAHIKKEKGGKAKSMNDFGYGRGYAHVYDQMRLLQADLDRLVATGKNVILLCQFVKDTDIDTGQGEYYLAYPDLFNKGNSPVLPLYIAWASYVFKIDWAQIDISANKIGVASDHRAVYTKPEISFEAKSRGSAFKQYPIVAFDEESDDSVWRILFGLGGEEDGE